MSHLKHFPPLAIIGGCLGAIAIVSAGAYLPWSDFSSQDAPSSSGQSTGQLQTIGSDPFRELLDKQQATTLQPSKAIAIQTVQSGDNTTATKVPVGTDPFKAFLDAQLKAKQEEVSASPFGK